MVFLNREEAGKALAKRIRASLPSETLRKGKILVLGLPRGGVAVAAPVARELSLPLDVLVVRKLGVPGHEEFAFGAVDLDGQMVVEGETIRRLNLSSEKVNQVVERELKEAQRRAGLYRKGKGELKISGKTVIVVDDGLATGATAEAAVGYVRRRGPMVVILASPVASPEAFSRLKKLVDSAVVLEVPDNFDAVGQFYSEFSQTSDAEVIRLLS